MVIVSPYIREEQTRACDKSSSLVRSHHGEENENGERVENEERSGRPANLSQSLLTIQTKPSYETAITLPIQLCIAVSVIFTLYFLHKRLSETPVDPQWSRRSSIFSSQVSGAAAQPPLRSTVYHYLFRKGRGVVANLSS